MEEECPFSSYKFTEIGYFKVYYSTVYNSYQSEFSAQLEMINFDYLGDGQRGATQTVLL